VFVYSSCGKWVFPPLLWSFPPSATLQAFPLLVAGRESPFLPSPAGLFIYSSSSSALRAPTLFATCLYCSYCLLLSFSFFPWVGVGLSRGLCWSGPGLSVGVPCTA
jgi:hypothetical protein